MCKRDRINVGLSSWIIQDGNYDDFHVDQEISFALEFEVYSIAPSNQTSTTAIHTQGSRYQVNGKVVFHTKAASVIDVGFLAYQEDATPSEHIKLGDYVEGDIHLGIDPF